jgi:hypothetical protein
LVTKGDVAVVSTTRALLPGAADICLWPDVRNSLRACRDELNRLSTPERLLGRLDQFDLENFARNYPRAKDHASIEAANS